jgi:DNA-binding protein H-NS
MDLRMRVDEMLVEHRAKLIEQLERIAVVGGTRVGRGGGGALKGRKVPPKYRSRSGETWAGRGARPKWMVEALKEARNSTIF